MRQVMIVEQARDQHPWIAVDVVTRKTLLRMQRLETLLSISKNLGWQVLTESELKQMAPGSATAA